MDALSPGSLFYVAPNNNKIGPMTEEVIREKVRSGEYTGAILASSSARPCRPLPPRRAPDRPSATGFSACWWTV